MWNLPRPGIEPVSPALAGRFFTTEPPGKPQTSLSQCPFPCSDRGASEPEKGLAEEEESKERTRMTSHLGSERSWVCALQSCLTPCSGVAPFSLPIQAPAFQPGPVAVHTPVWLPTGRDGGNAPDVTIKSGYLQAQKGPGPRFNTSSPSFYSQRSRDQKAKQLIRGGGAGLEGTCCPADPILRVSRAPESAALLPAGSLHILPKVEGSGFPPSSLFTHLHPPLLWGGRLLT